MELSKFPFSIIMMAIFALLALVLFPELIIKGIRSLIQIMGAIIPKSPLVAK
jgi:hypothetical protein